jgi:hypothetical protein
MQTISKQTKSMLVDLSTMISDTNNPIIKAFKNKGSVFGFASYYIVADKLNLTQTTINNVDLLLDSDNKTYKVCTTKDICPSFTKGIGRSKSGIDIKTHLVNQSDYLCNTGLIVIYQTSLDYPCLVYKNICCFKNSQNRLIIFRLL